MSRSEKDAVGGHNPHRPGFEWQSKRSTFLFNDPGKEAKQRASSVHHMRDKAIVREEARDTEGDIE
jgi:hypothetical protein